MSPYISSSRLKCINYSAATRVTFCLYQNKIKKSTIFVQDASLQGFPESPKSVVLITGSSEYNSVSLNKTLKACLWEMGSPFLPCKTRSGLLVAKAHSLRMWLKDSPFCLDLELRDGRSLPELNSMRLVDGCFLRRGLVPAFKEITEKLGSVLRPKKFSRLAMLSNERRGQVIEADIEGKRQKLEKLRKKVNDGTRESLPSNSAGAGLGRKAAN